MKVLVMTAIAENEEDLQIVMVARAYNITMASPAVTLKGAADGRRGNPYLVYGDAVEAFTGCDKFNTCITVAECTSGDLAGWL